MPCTTSPRNNPLMNIPMHSDILPLEVPFAGPPGVEPIYWLIKGALALLLVVAFDCTRKGAPQHPQPRAFRQLALGSVLVTILSLGGAVILLSKKEPTWSFAVMIALALIAAARTAFRVHRTLKADQNPVPACGAGGESCQQP